MFYSRNACKHHEKGSMYIISLNSFNDSWRWTLFITEKEEGLQELTEA